MRVDYVAGDIWQALVHGGGGGGGGPRGFRIPRLPLLPLRLRLRLHACFIHHRVPA